MPKTQHLWKSVLATFRGSSCLKLAFFSDEALFTKDSAQAAGVASNIIDKILLLASIALVTTIAVLHDTASLHAAIFAPFGLPEEAAYTFISAQNYLEYGFLNSLFLQDFSTSPVAADHPFVYNHMPAGPDIFAATLLWVTDSNYVAMRAIYSAIAVAGFGVYFVFAKAFLSRLGLIGAGTALLFVSPWTLVQLIERQIYAPFALLAFLPLLLYLRYVESGNRAKFYLALGIIFVSSIYFEYSLLSGMAACWGMLFLTRLLPIRVWEFACITAAFAAGIAAHLFQNILYLGWATFTLELQHTLSNRITGFPTQAELADFYRKLALVHHGSHPVKLGVIWQQIVSNLSFTGLRPALLAAAACLAWIGLVTLFNRTSGSQQSTYTFAHLTLLFARLLTWAVGIILAPILLFPAFAQEVNLRGLGASAFYVGIVFAAMAGVTWSLLAYIGHRAVSVVLWPKAAAAGMTEITGAGSAIARLLILVALSASVWVMWSELDASAQAIMGQSRFQLGQIRTIRRDANRWTPLHALERFRGALFMTNINVPTVGVIVRAPGFGACPPESVETNGGFQLRLCKTAFMRRYDYWTTQRPQYFYYFHTPDLFPGFADCLPPTTLLGQQRRGQSCMDDLLDRLSRNYRLVMENRLMKAFDLSRPARK